MRLERVSAAERQQLHQQVAQLHQFREQRLQQEREGARARAAGGAAARRPRPMNLPHSPIAARPAPHPAGSHAEVARRSEDVHASPARSEAARRSTTSGQPSRATPGEGNAAHRPAAGAAGSRAQPRTATSRSGTRESARTPARGRAPTAEEEERRRRGE